jgi:hypothetical protein
MTRSHNISKIESEDLPPLLEEFRAALHDKIDEATSNSSNTSISLRNGHKTSPPGSPCQYVFSTGSNINALAGVPYNLIIPSQPPIEASIVSAEGHRVIVSLEPDLGQTIPVAHLQTDLAIMMRRLIGHIENKAAARQATATETRVTDDSDGTRAGTLSNLDLYPSRMLALESSLGRNLRFIWGLPKNSKIPIMGTIVEQLYNSGQSVLFVGHTHSAVDRAIKQIVKPLQNFLPRGIVIRAGEVWDNNLGSTYPDIFIERQAELQSRELSRHKEDLISEKGKLVDELRIIDNAISILQWLESSDSGIQTAMANIEQLQQSESQFALNEETWTDLKQHLPGLIELQKLTSRVLIIRSDLLSKREKHQSLIETLPNICLEIDHVAAKLQDQRFRSKIADRIDLLRRERAAYPPVDEQTANIRNLSAQIAKSDILSEEIQRRYNAANSLLSQIHNSNYLGRVLKHLPKREEQTEIVHELFAQLSDMKEERKFLRETYNIAKNNLSRTLELDAALMGHEDIGTPSEEHARESEYENSLKPLEETKIKLQKDSEQLSTSIRELEKEEKEIIAHLDGDPELISMEAGAKIRVAQEIQASVISGRLNSKQLREDTNSILDRLLSQLSRWMPIIERPISEQQKLDFISECSRKLASQYNPTELPSLVERADLRRWSIRKLTEDINELDKNLTQTRNSVIKNAHIIGATMTDIYLDEIVQSRRFDTVIVDEVSLAPILTLWVAALLADRNLVIAGDFD